MVADGPHPVILSRRICGTLCPCKARKMASVASPLAICRDDARLVRMHDLAIAERSSANAAISEGMGWKREPLNMRQTANSHREYHKIKIELRLRDLPCCEPTVVLCASR